MPRRTIASSISGSTLPPETTATTGDGQRPGYSATAATAAAPAGSTSSLPRSRLHEHGPGQRLLAHRHDLGDLGG